MTLRVLAFAVLASLTAAPSHAGSEREWNWSISAFGGGTFRGPSHDIEKAMEVWRFDAYRPPGFLSEGREHPVSTAGSSVWVKATRRVKGPFSIGAHYGRTDLGTTSGYHALGGDLGVDYQIDAFALLVSFQDRSMLGSFLHKELFELTGGLGPALYQIRSGDPTPDGSKDGDATRLGLLLDLGLRAPSNRRFFIEVVAQYRLAGTVAIGPYEVVSGRGTAVLPETDASFSHFVFGLGVGLRM